MKYLKSYIFIVFLLLVSSFSYTQETYQWTHRIQDSLFQMYKYDFLHPEDGGDLLFEIHERRFSHPNMTGFENKIRSFEFNSDRTTVYFLEEEGDLYQYTIDTDQLTYIEDISPATSPILVHVLQRTYNIYKVNDSIFYFTGDASIEYNLFSRSSTIYRRIPSPPEIFTPYERSVNLQNILAYKNKIIGQVADMTLVYPNVQMPENRTTWFKPENIDDSSFELVAYHHDCDSVALFYWQYDPLTQRRVYMEMDTFGIFRGVQNLPRGIQFPGQGWFNRIKNYPGFDYKAACLRLVNLDEDESTQPGPDYKIDRLCNIENIPLGDDDTRVSHSSVVDSIVITFSNNTLPCLFNAFQGNYDVINRGHTLIFKKRNNTKNVDYSSGIKQSTCTCESLSPGQSVHYSVTAWYQGSPGNPAWGTLQLSDTLPYAGIDVEISYCLEKDSLIHVTTLLDVEATSGGIFFENNINLNSDSVILSPDQSMEILYIVGQQTCPDTARIMFAANPFPETASVPDIIACNDQPVEVDLSFLTGDISWEDGFSGLYRVFTQTGQYTYTVTGNGGCQAADSFSVFILPKADIQQIELTACPGTFFTYESQTYQGEGTDTFRLQNSLGCDSLITVVLRRFFPVTEPDWMGPQGLCPGESDTLQIYEPIQDLTINNQSVLPVYLIESPGFYTIEGKDKNGCLVRWEAEIEAYEPPYVFLSTMSDTLWTPDLSPDVDFSTDIVSYAWSPADFFDCSDCPYPHFNPGSSGNFSVEVTNQAGCRSVATSYLSFFEEEIVLPNVISQNGQLAQNKSFYLQSKHPLRYDLTIYDRWGNIHFDQKNLMGNDPGQGWRPTENVISGVYVYVLTIYTWNGDKTYFGDITLIE
jgi:hypothetical protein